MLRVDEPRDIRDIWNQQRSPERQLRSGHMCGSMPRVCVMVSNLRRDNVGAPDVSTHSVGDGTDSIVKLRTTCGNLENTF